MIKSKFTIKGNTGKKSGMIIAMLFISQFLLFSQAVIKHSYTFENGVTDQVGNVHGVLKGNAQVKNGALICAQNGDYVSFDGTQFNFNNYSAITLEYFVVPGNGTNPGWTGLSYFGENDGKRAFFTGIARGDNQSICFYNYKAEIKSNREHDDGKYHHVVSILTREFLRFYIDGKLVGESGWSGTIDIGTTHAYLAKLGWAADPTWIGQMLEFNIYEGVMDTEMVRQRALTFDNDSDGVANHEDNCPDNYNPDQNDQDKDGIGDVCDKIATLAGLTVEGARIEPEFSPEVFNYSVYAPIDVTELNFSVTPAMPDFLVTGNSKLDISSGSGVASFKVSKDGYDDGVYTIKVYGLKLEHSYTFEKDASDKVGSVHGKPEGNALVENGMLILSQSGDFLSFNGAAFDFNSYESITMEHFVIAGNGTNTGWTGLSYFGNDNGSKAFFTGIARGDNKSISFYDFKAEVKANREHDYGKYHHVVSVLSRDFLKFYIDGVLIGQSNLTGNIDIGTTHAYLGKLGWAADPTWNGKILEFNIYRGAMSETMINQRRLLFDADGDGIVDDVDAVLEGWNANWIWQEEDGPKDTWMSLRKEVTLESIPSKAIARIAAESKYWLWVNGHLVVFEGQLKRDMMDKLYYDQIDLAPYLVQGKNTIAVLVWYWGREGFSHHDTGKGGFLFDADFGSVNVVSDDSWKLKIQPGYEHSISGGQPNFRLSEWNIRFNAAKDTISGWQLSGYDDSAWINATNKGIPPVLPWNTLLKRPFPQWFDSGLKEYTNALSLPKAGNGANVEAVLPYNARISAYLKVKAPAGKLINIQTDQYDGWYAFGDGPAVRAEYITKDGEQEFETLLWMSGNTVRYTIPAGVEIISLKYREIGYPSEFTGEFKSNDPFYDKLWIMARRTLYINMFDNFMDCPERERALWWGDVVNQSGEVFYTLDTVAHALIRKSIYTLIDWQRDDFTLFSPTSTKWTSELPQQMLASIGWYGFWNYFVNTNDSATIKDAYPAVKKYLSIWKMGANGLVVHRRGAWDWGDWGTNIDIEVLDNAWYYLALKAAIPMAVLSGYAHDTVDYGARMKSIEDNFAKVFWKSTDKHFRSSALSIPDDRGNAMAVIAGLAKPEHFDGVRKVLTERSFASPYMEKYVLEALCKIGSDSLSLVRMKSRYEEMVNHPQYNTLWEVWSGLKEGTINHGWNAPNTVLSQNIAGISPLEPGWTLFEVLPRMGGLKEVSQKLTSVKGDIVVSHKLTDTNFRLNLSAPVGTKAIVGIPVKYNISVISLNGTPIWNAGKYVTGNEDVEFIGVDGQFIKFAVKNGVWTFDANINQNTALSVNEQKDCFRIKESLNFYEIIHEYHNAFTLTIFDLTGHQVKNTIQSTGLPIILNKADLPIGLLLFSFSVNGYNEVQKVNVVRS